MRRGRVGFGLRLAVVVLRPWLTVLTRRRWQGRGHIPRSGAVILAVNHVSYIDPFVLAHFVYEAGRPPRFLAKASVFRIPVVGWIVRQAGQLPVQRYTENSGQALDAALAALGRGECVVIYPEGTVTKDPAYWPMRARTGVARLALQSGAPVVPVAQWGAQKMLGRDQRPHLLPPKLVSFRAGPVVDLSGYAGREQTGKVLREVTDVVMDRIRGLLGELRAERPPTEVFDPRRLTPVASGDERRSA